MAEVRSLSSVSSVPAAGLELHWLASHCLPPSSFQRLALISHGASTQSQADLSPFAPSLPPGGLSVLPSSQVHHNPSHRPLFPKGNFSCLTKKMEVDKDKFLQQPKLISSQALPSAFTSLLWLTLWLALSFQYFPGLFSHTSVSPPPSCSLHPVSVLTPV